MNTAKIIRTVTSNPQMVLGALAAGIVSLTLLIWVMKGDDDDRSSRSCRALWVVFLGGALYVNREYIMKTMQGRPASTRNPSEEFVASLRRSYYDPR